MRYHIYNNRDASKPFLCLPFRNFVFLFSGLIYKRWEYFLAVDTTELVPVYEWTKNRNMDGTVNMDGPHMVRDAELLERAKEAPRPMRNYQSKLST